MLFVLGVVLAILFLLVIMVVHEAGHFFAARFFGMQTPVVGLGVPFGGPSWILGRYKDVEFRFHALLIGAYVAIPEMDDESAKELESFNIQLSRPAREFPAWQRLIVSLAGPAANVALALLISFVAVFALNGVGVSKSNIFISGISDAASISVKESLQPKDQILNVNDEHITNYPTLLEKLIEHKNNTNKNITLTILRNEETLSLPITLNDNYKLGITLDIQNEYVSQSLKGKPLSTKINSATSQFKEWWDTSIKSITMLLQAPLNFVMGKETLVKATDVRGPITIIRVLANIFETQPVLLFKMWGILSIYIGLINLVPMLPLDGGHILFQITEIITGGRKFKKLQDLIAKTGLLLIFGLLFLVMFNDFGVAALISNVMGIFK